MLLPVTCFNRSIRDRVSTVNHHPIADINTNVRCTGGIISALEEDKVSRLCRASGDNITYTHQTVCGQSANAPSVAAVIDDPRNKTGAVKGSGGTASTPYIRVSQILLRFPDHVGKSGIRQSFTRNVIVGVFAGDCIDVVPKISGRFPLVWRRIRYRSISSSVRPELPITRFKPLFTSFTFRI